MKHTPAPWNIDFETNEDGPMISDEMHDVIAVVHPSQDGDLTDRANAQLISAAPEMLVEIERFLTIAKREGWHASVTQLEKIITKARGEA